MKREGETLSQSEIYARWRATTLGSITERVEADVVFALIGELAHQRVLDVGCGDGTYAIKAAECGAFVTALDVDPTMLDAAQARATEHGVSLAVCRGRAEDLPFEENSFDVVMAITVLCFSSDAPKAIREMSRVLAPGGTIIIGELSRYSVWALERRVRGWFGAKRWQQARFWSRRDLDLLVEKVGLHVTEHRGSVFFPPNCFAARMMAPYEPMLTRLDAPGAAFLAIRAKKPVST